MIRKSFQDRTYAMALMPLCCNIAFEFVYLLNPPENVSSLMVIACWLALNVPVVVTAIRFAPREWGHAPFVQRNLPWIFAVSIISWMTAHLALIAQLGPAAAVSWSAWFCLLFFSSGSLCQLMDRGGSRGTSLFIW
jgi:paspaline synthase